MRDHLVRIYDATLNPNTSVGASFDYRFALINVSTHALAANTRRAVWGYGPGAFNSLNLKGPFRGDPEFLFWSCDSSWLKFMVETGYGGLLIMAVLLLTPVILTLRNYQRFEGPEAKLSGVLLVNLMAFYFMMISVAMYSWAQIGFLLWILITLSVASGRVVRHSRSDVALDSDIPYDPIFSDAQPLVYRATPADWSGGKQRAIDENGTGLAHWTTEGI
ncbi:MAG: hypothetical protein P8Z30_08175 [Acidobacteriota bacterium]